MDELTGFVKGQKMDISVRRSYLDFIQLYLILVHLRVHVKLLISTINFPFSDLVIPSCSLQVNVFYFCLLHGYYGTDGYCMLANISQ